MIWIRDAPLTSAELSGPARPLMASTESDDGSGAPAAKMICVCFERPWLCGLAAAVSVVRVSAGGGVCFATRAGAGAGFGGGDAGVVLAGPKLNGTAVAPMVMSTADDEGGGVLAV